MTDQVLKNPTITRTAALLKRWRQARGLSQEQLAEQLDSSVRHISCVENARNLPSRALVLKMAKVLALNVAQSNQLLRGWQHATHVAAIDWTHDDHAALREQVDRQLQAADPLPAIAMDCAGNIRRVNNSAAALFAALLPGESAEQQNLFALALEPGPVFDAIGNHPVLIPQLLAHMRAEQSLLAPQTESWQLLEAQIQAAEQTDHAAGLQLPAAVAAFDIDLQIGTQRLRFISQPSTVGTPYDSSGQSLRIETFYPV